MLKIFIEGEDGQKKFLKQVVVHEEDLAAGPVEAPIDSSPVDSEPEEREQEFDRETTTRKNDEIKILENELAEKKEALVGKSKKKKIIQQALLAFALRGHKRN